MIFTNELLRNILKEYRTELANYYFHSKKQIDPYFFFAWGSYPAAENSKGEIEIIDDTDRKIDQMRYVFMNNPL